MTASIERVRCNATTLGTFELFKTLSMDERDAIAAGMTAMRGRRNEFLIRADDIDRDVRFVVTGAVRTCVYSEDGKQVQFEDLGPGAMFGELAAIDGERRSADCFALVDSVLANLPAGLFMEAVREHPTVADAVLRRLTGMVRRQLRRVLEFSTVGVGQRTRLELLRLAASGTRRDDHSIVFDKVPTHADIAARISTHREAVSREIKSLEAAGLITWRPGIHIIHDVAQLSESARSIS